MIQAARALVWPFKNSTLLRLAPACIAIFYIIISRAVGNLDFLIMYSRVHLD